MVWSLGTVSHVVSDSIPLILAKFQPAVLHCEVSRTLTVSLVLPVSSDVAEVVEEAADDETVFRNVTCRLAGEVVSLECVVSHSAGILVVTVTRYCEVVALLEECYHVLNPISIGRTEKVDDMGLGTHCRVVHLRLV